MSGNSASGGAPAADEERGRRAMQRDQVVGGERGAGVIERALVVGEVERYQAE